MTMQRRDFLRSAAWLAAGLAAAPVMAQQAPQAGGPIGAANVPMNDVGAYKPVRPEPKPGATRSMQKEEQDALERTLRCQCGCTLDVYTCRTTDFTCQMSPAMHRDITAMVEGGYSAQEIVDLMVGAYGERVLMAPKKEGFNWAAYIAPFAAVGTGAVALAALLKRWRDRAERVAAATPARTVLPVDATPEELASLESAVRAEDR